MTVTIPLQSPEGFKVTARDGSDYAYADSFEEAVIDARQLAIESGNECVKLSGVGPYTTDGPERGHSEDSGEGG